MQTVEGQLRNANVLLESIRVAQTAFISSADTKQAFATLLEVLLDVTQGEYGFIGEVLRKHDGDPYLRTHAITNIAWNAWTRDFYEKNAPTGLEFLNMKTLFGAVITTGKSVIANDPAHDPRRGGLPPDHPAMHAFLGLPFSYAGELVGMVGVANRPGGFDDALAQTLEPLLVTCGSLVGGMRIDRDRRRAEAALAESEKRFRQLAGTIEEAFWLLDLKESLKVIYLSQGYEAIWGRTCQSQIEATFDWRDALHPEDRERVIRGLIVESKLGRYQMEYRIIRPDGGLRWIRDRIFPVLDESGSVVRLAGLSEDITRRKQAEKERSVLEAQLLQSQKMQAIGTLAGGIAHDFNNLLAGIVGNADLARVALSPDDPAGELIGAVLDASARAKDLVSQILTFSRQNESKREPIALAPVILETVKLVRIATPPSIEIRVDLPQECPAVLADASQIHQVVMNLITNAVHAIGPMSGVVEISLGVVDIDEATTRREPQLKLGRHLEICVRDTGSGMDAATSARIFEPFFTTKPPGEGTGLGLAVVHGIAERHGASIRVASEPGKGSTFRLTLPAAVETEPAREAPASTAPSLGGGRRVLFVEDEPSLLRLATRMLERLDYCVTAFNSGRAAVAAFRDAPDYFDLVLTDLTMQEQDGLALAGEILALRPNIPIVLCTGYGGGLDAARLTQLGIRGLLNKPYTFQELGRAVDSALTLP